METDEGKACREVILVSLRQTRTKDDADSVITTTILQKAIKVMFSNTLVVAIKGFRKEAQSRTQFADVCI